MRARISSSLSCTSSATVATAASALFFVMASPSAAAVSAAVAASATAAFIVAIFCTFSGSASLTSCSRSLYSDPRSSSRVWSVSSSFFCVSFDFNWRRFVATWCLLCFFWDLELRHDTSVITSHVYHVVGLCVFAPAAVFSVGQDVIQLFLYTLRSMISHLFLRYLLVLRVQRDQILLKQPLCHPFASAVRIVKCVVTNTWQFNAITWTKFCVGVTSNEFHLLLFVNYFAERFVCFSTWWSG